MNNDRTIIIENISKQSIVLKDTQMRTYRLSPSAKMRISRISLQDILDYPASRVILNEGYVRISNIDAESLYNMGLNEEEIEKYTGEIIAAVVVTKDLTKEEEKVEEVVEKPAAKKATTTKSTTKKTTTKKTSSSKK